MVDDANGPDVPQDSVPRPRTLGEIGLQNFAPYLMNRIMGRYNQSLHEQLGKAGLSVAKMRALAVLSVIDGLMTNELCGLRGHRAVDTQPHPRRA